MSVTYLHDCCPDLTANTHPVSKGLALPNRHVIDVGNRCLIRDRSSSRSLIQGSHFSSKVRE